MLGLHSIRITIRLELNWNNLSFVFNVQGTILYYYNIVTDYLILLLINSVNCYCLLLASTF